jgi:hypothetical protein
VGLGAIIPIAPSIIASAVQNFKVIHQQQATLQMRVNRPIALRKNAS